MSIKVNLYNQKAEVIGEENLSEHIFGLDMNLSLVHQAAVAQMSNERQVLAHTKTKAEVRGGGKKPWRQKGTGRARAGSSRSPIWIGGGVTFGPRSDRNFKKKINVKMKQKAIDMVLSDKAKNNNLVLLDNIILAEFKTKAMNGLIAGLEKEAKLQVKEEKSKRSILVVNAEKDEKLKFSTRNLAGVCIINIENINILDLLKYKNLILTKKALLMFEAKAKK